MDVNTFEANCSPVWGTKYLQFDWFVPQAGLAVVCLERVKIALKGRGFWGHNLNILIEPRN